MLSRHKPLKCGQSVITTHATTKVHILYANLGCSLAPSDCFSNAAAVRKTHLDELLEAAPQGQVKGRRDYCTPAEPTSSLFSLMLFLLCSCALCHLQHSVLALSAPHQCIMPCTSQLALLLWLFAKFNFSLSYNIVYLIAL